MSWETIKRTLFLMSATAVAVFPAVVLIVVVLVWSGILEVTR